MPIIGSEGAASSQGFGQFAQSGAVNYIEDVFSTWLYPGDSGGFVFASSRVDITGGGMFWVKGRGASTNNFIFSPSLTSANHYLQTNTTAAQSNSGVSDNNFEPITNGGGMRFGGAFTGISSNAGGSGTPYASWTFRKAPRFFDVVTYTGNSGTQNISHNLGSVPGCIIIKMITTAGYRWRVYHRSLGNTSTLNLDLTGGVNTGQNTWNSTTPTSTVFSLGNDPTSNLAGESFVAYLFAHDSGGFGLSGNDNVISCGSYELDGFGEATVNLGYEPQLILYKSATSTGDWRIVDNMRGWSTGDAVADDDSILRPNTSGAETKSGIGFPTATGFKMMNGGAVNTFIYIAIRRGPMKVPTTGTSVFAPVTYTGNGSTTRTVNTTITPDAAWFFHRDTANGQYWYDRLRGNNRFLRPNETSAETSFGSTGAAWGFDVQNAVYLNGSADYINGSSALNGLWALKRAPGFFDEVCYAGTGATNKTKNHNLGAVPELMIIKNRGPSGFDQNWMVYPGPLGTDKFMYLNTTAAAGTFGAFWDNTPPTSTTFSVGNYQDTNASTLTYVAYLFASCPGVSKVGSFTGTGATQVINCGFTGGARFVLIKATSTTGDWYVWDSARGIVAGNDPYLRLNSTAAEVTNTDWVDTAASGFELSNAGGNLANSNGVSYIFWAVA